MEIYVLIMSSVFSYLLTEVDISDLAIQLENPDFLNKVNSTRDRLGKNILHILTYDQNVEVFRCVHHKVDKGLINEKSANGQTPLCFGLATKPTSEDFFLELISRYDCDVTIPDKRHLTPLHYAVFYGEHRIAEKILQCGANIDAKSITGITPLYLAVEKNDYEMMSLLLYYNADVSIECEENNPTSRAITSSLLHCIDREFLDMAEILLDYIVDVNEPFSNGVTLLYRAIRKQSQIMHSILQKGANINHKCYGKHCIMAVRKIPGAVTRKELFEHLWPMVDVKFMLENCPFDLYELFFKYNLLSDNFFASIFVDYDVEDTIDFAKFFLVPSERERDCKGSALVQSLNRTEESLLGIFCSLLLVYDQITGYLLHSILDKYGFGRLFWIFVHVNVEIVDYTQTILQEFKLSMFVFDAIYFGGLIYPFWRHYFVLTNVELAEGDVARVELPSLEELSRTIVRRCCRRDKDMETKRLFAFINRIKTIGLPKICEDVLLLRRPIYHF